MNFREMLVEEVIKPAIRSQPRVTTGIVLAYHKEHNICTVRLNPSSLQATIGQTLIQVPVAVSNCFNVCGPFPGQRVIIEFLDGQPNNPVIIGVLDLAYQSSVREGYQTHEERGAYLSDSISGRKFQWTDAGPGWGVK